MKNQFKELSEQDLLNTVGGGWWEDFTNNAKDFMRGLEKSIAFHAGIR